MYRKILIAHDGSPWAEKAFSSAVEFAARFDAELHMISVEELPAVPASIDEVIEEKREGNRLFDKVAGRSRAEATKRSVVLHTHVVTGHAVPRIVEFVERGEFDLLVVGYMGHSALYNRLIGSTTDRLVEHAPCAVLVVK
jgi:nucleotide-binding universal stress UspA family protein